LKELEEMKARSFKRDIRMVMLGVLMTVLVLPGISVLANTVTRELSFTGVNVQVNGVPVNFDADSQPFIMDGRTFLPVGAIANAVGKEVGWDGVTQTVHLNTPGVAITPAPAPTPAPPARDARPLFQVFTRPLVAGPTIIANNNGGQSVTFDGRLFANSWVVSTVGVPTTDLRFSLNGDWNEIFGYMGSQAAGQRGISSTVSFFGDGGIMLEEFTVTYGDPAFNFSVNVAGQQQLDIRIDRTATGTGITLLSPQIR
jgi:hypothetical protein